MSANRGYNKKTVSIPGAFSLTRSAHILGEKSPNRGISVEAIGIDYVPTTEFAQVASAFDVETVTMVFAAILGIGAGLGVPFFLVKQEERDKENLQRIRELNRATLKITGEQMNAEDIKDLRPSRYFDRRKFLDCQCASCIRMISSWKPSTCQRVNPPKEAETTA